MPTQKGSIKLFRLFGIDVYVHWLWFLALYILPQLLGAHFTNYIWNIFEVLALFLIVLTHEFGHQLACRQVGGATHDIVLWPLGGVAYVTPPQRPGAQLWSIAAGPLVNVILIPVFAMLVSTAYHLGWAETQPNAYQLVTDIYLINFGLLIFNMIPVYPLDGGQILRSLLWFPFGRANSLLAVSIIGFVGVAGLFLLAVLYLFFSTSPIHGIWIGIMAAFILMNCWGGLMHARALAQMAKIPRRDGFACPSCKASPPLGELWRCGNCGNSFDMFASHAACPHCGARFNLIQCMDCGTRSAASEWGVRSIF